MSQPNQFPNAVPPCNFIDVCLLHKMAKSSGQLEKPAVCGSVTNASSQFDTPLMVQGKRFKHLDNLFTYLSDLEKSLNYEDYLHPHYYSTLLKSLTSRCHGN